MGTKVPLGVNPLEPDSVSMVFVLNPPNMDDVIGLFLIV